MEKMAAGKSFEDLDKVKERYGKLVENFNEEEEKKEKESGEEEDGAGTL